MAARCEVCGLVRTRRVDRREYSSFSQRASLGGTRARPPRWTSPSRESFEAHRHPRRRRPSAHRSRDARRDTASGHRTRDQRGHGGSAGHRMEGLRRAARVREGAGAARLGQAGRAQDQARGDPPPREQARGADRLDIRESRRTGRIRPAGPRRGGGTGRRRSGPIRRGRLGHSRRRRQHPCAVLSQRAEPAAVLRRLVDSHDRDGVASHPRQDGRARATLRRGQRRAPAPHLHRRHGPRSRLPAPARRRPRAHLHGHLRGHLHRADLRQHVPPPRSGDGPGRRGRPGRLHRGDRGGVREPARLTATAVSRASCPCARAPGRTRCALAGDGPVAARVDGLLADCGARPSRPRRPTHRAR